MVFKQLGEARSVYARLAHASNGIAMAQIQRPQPHVDVQAGPPKRLLCICAFTTHSIGGILTGYGLVANLCRVVGEKCALFT